LERWNSVKDGCIAQDTAACWTNPTADSSFNIDSVGIVITDNGHLLKDFLLVLEQQL
jgi:hypothetical protein